MVRTRQPNAGHFALAYAEQQYTECGRSFHVITQNIDGLHTKAGNHNVLEIHGNLYKTRCLECNDVRKNPDSPICPALLGRGLPNVKMQKYKPIPASQLPRCQNMVVDEIMSNTDVCLVVGTSAVVYPAASFAPSLARRGVPVAEINIEVTPSTDSLQLVSYLNLFTMCICGFPGIILSTMFYIYVQCLFLFFVLLTMVLLNHSVILYYFKSLLHLNLIVDKQVNVDCRFIIIKGVFGVVMFSKLDS
ncbi:unnamed protein product [Trichobilharzia regenti]|nr:unnamed protein product [Trichobilharzia regenti]